MSNPNRRYPEQAIDPGDEVVALLAMFPPGECPYDKKLNGWRVGAGWTLFMGTREAWLCNETYTIRRIVAFSDAADEPRQLQRHSGYTLEMPPRQVWHLCCRKTGCWNCDPDTGARGGF